MVVLEWSLSGIWVCFGLKSFIVYEAVRYEVPWNVNRSEYEAVWNGVVWNTVSFGMRSTWMKGFGMICSGRQTFGLRSWAPDSLARSTSHFLKRALFLAVFTSNKAETKGQSLFHLRVFFFFLLSHNCRIWHANSSLYIYRDKLVFSSLSSTTFFLYFSSVVLFIERCLM